MQLDNCYIEMNAPEPPVADGSAIVFASLITKAGIVEQDVERKIIVIDQVYTVREEDKFITIIPYDGFRFHLRQLIRIRCLASSIVMLKSIRIVLPSKLLRRGRLPLQKRLKP